MILLPNVLRWLRNLVDPGYAFPRSTIGTPFKDHFATRTLPPSFTNMLHHMRFTL
jgi:hypothetical protein